MGTFHDDKHALHGITVVVDTDGDRVFIGRCDDMNDESIVLFGAGEHVDGAGGTSKAEYIAKAAKVGVWQTHARLVLPMDSVTTVRPLNEYA